MKYVKLHDKKLTPRSFGFTIVELLIVIVVIGILAAITIVAYNGMQTRASNSKQLAAASAYYKLIQLYKTQNDSFPLAISDPVSCLGTNYVDTNSNGVADCGDNATGVINTTLNDRLKTMGNLPDAVTTVLVDSTGFRRSGIMYNPNWGGNPIIVFFLQSTNTADCNIGGQMAYSGVAAPNSLYCLVYL